MIWARNDLGKPVCWNAHDPGQLGGAHTEFRKFVGEKLARVDRFTGNDRLL